MGRTELAANPCPIRPKIGKILLMMPIDSGSPIRLGRSIAENELCPDQAANGGVKAVARREEIHAR
jgi:hypothetical protein